MRVEGRVLRRVLRREQRTCTVPARHDTTRIVAFLAKFILSNVTIACEFLNFSPKFRFRFRFREYVVRLYFYTVRYNNFFTVFFLRAGRGRQLSEYLRRYTYHSTDKFTCKSTFFRGEQQYTQTSDPQQAYAKSEICCSPNTK